MFPRVSVIIAARDVDQNLEQCVEYCARLDYPDFEILVLLDRETATVFPKARVIVTGPIPPSQKRNIGAGHATGELLAFIDADAYPSRKWLQEAAKDFEGESVRAVGGPAVTPRTDTLHQKASGLIYSSFLVGGPYKYRYSPHKKQEVNDCQTCNLIIRKRVFQQLGGFEADFWPGEDTELSAKLKKIVYDPKVLVYHHRRDLFIPHLRQIWGYATTPFITTGRKGVLKMLHLVPSLFVLGIVAGTTLFLAGYLRSIFMFTVFAYLALVLTSTVQSCGKSNLKAAPLVFIGIILTHVTYGVGVIKYAVTGGWEK